MLAVSPDQRVLATSGPGSTVAIEDTRTGAQVGSVPISTTYLGFEFMPNDAALIATDELGAVRILVLVPHERRLSHATDLPAIAASALPTLSPDGRRLAISDGPNLSILDTTTGAIIRQRTIPNGGIDQTLSQKPVVFSPNGDVVALTTFDQTTQLQQLYLYDIGNDTLHKASKPTFIFDLAFLSSQTLAVVDGLPNFQLEFLDVPSGRPSATPLPGLQGLPISVAGSPIAGTLAVSTTNGSTTQIELFSGNQPLNRIRILGGSDLQFSPDGKTLVFKDDRGRLELRAMPSGTPIGLPINADHIVGIAFDPQSHLVATGNDDGTIQLLDLNSASAIGPPLAGHTASVASLTFTSAGSLISAASDPLRNQPGQVLEWRLGTAALERKACIRANRDLTTTEWTQLVGGAFPPYASPCGEVLASRRA